MTDSSVFDDGAQAPRQPAVDTQQVAMQCAAVRHMAFVLGEIHGDYARMLAAGHFKSIASSVGKRTAYLMEVLGNTLNGMDAVEDSDEWLAPIFERAQMDENFTRKQRVAVSGSPQARLLSKVTVERDAAIAELEQVRAERDEVKAKHRTQMLAHSIIATVAAAANEARDTALATLAERTQERDHFNRLVNSTAEAAGNAMKGRDKAIAERDAEIARLKAQLQPYRDREEQLRRMIGDPAKGITIPAADWGLPQNTAAVGGGGGPSTGFMLTADGRILPLGGGGYSAPTYPNEATPAPSQSANEPSLEAMEIVGHVATMCGLNQPQEAARAIDGFAAVARREGWQQAIEAIEEPNADLIERCQRVAIATGAHVNDAQMHDICQAIADEIKSALTPPPEETPQ